MFHNISFAGCFYVDGDEGEHGAATSTPAVYLPCTYSTLQNRPHVKIRLFCIWFECNAIFFPVTNNNISLTMWVKSANILKYSKKSKKKFFESLSLCLNLHESLYIFCNYLVNFLLFRMRCSGVNKCWLLRDFFLLKVLIGCCLSSRGV